jgi:hypothetical protein
MSTEYVKHLIECHCVLPQYRNRVDLVYHKFAVFSLLESDNVVEKLVRCNNCDAVHRVYDVCKSEIFIGDLDLTTIRMPQEILSELPVGLKESLAPLSLDMCTLEHILWCVENNKQEKLPLRKDTVKGKLFVKFITLRADGKWKFETESHSTEIN